MRIRRLLSGTLGSVFFLLLSSALFCQADEDCLLCHQDKELASEAGKSMFVDNQKFQASIHGQAGISCLDCHADLKKAEDFPHASPLRTVDCGQCHEAAAQEFQESVHQAANESGASTVRVGCKDCHGTHEIRAQDDFDALTFPLNLPATCERCHLEKVPSKKGADFISGYNASAHFKALEKAGLTMSANCSHCHDSHKIQRVDDPASLVSRTNIVRTCGSCHVGIQREYLEGVHGKDYVKRIKDVPVCTDCHSEHAIVSPEDINSKVYATKVAEVCVRCHDNIALSRQYGFLTSRLKTYNETFHGTAARFGETRVANCASCHGFHGIRPSSDPESSIHPDNLPQTCGQCHPGASRRFAEGQIHAIPEEAAAAKYRTSHVVKNIYIIVIAVIIGVMLVFIGVDFLRRLFGKEKHG
ncbi:MAG: ammonia-forming cytochrome c nitrite reductase subunit c552 [Candidatus Aminicenantales bacterium]